MLNQLIYMILFASIKNAESNSFLLMETDHNKTYLVKKTGTSIMAENDVKPNNGSRMRRTEHFGFHTNARMHSCKDKLLLPRRNTEICSTEEFRSNGQDGDPCRTHMDCSYLDEKYLCQWKTGTKEGKCKKISCSSNEDCHSFTDFPSKCYKRACIPKFCYANKDCPMGYGCHDMACKQILGQECELDCDCGSCNNKFCFGRHCYCKDDYRCTSIEQGLGIIATEKTELIMPEIAQRRDDSCTTAETDCIGTDKVCDGKQEGNCICKNNKCKISSGCGKQILGSYMDCNTCNTEDCEDEGACIIEDGNCVKTNIGNTNTTTNTEIKNVPTAIKLRDINTEESGRKQSPSHQITIKSTTNIIATKKSELEEEAIIPSPIATEMPDISTEESATIQHSINQITIKPTTNIIAPQKSELEEEAIIPIATEIPDMSTEESATIQHPINQITIKPTTNITAPQKSDNSCTTAETDCYGSRKLCDGNQDGNCICKNNKCKISSNCGTDTLGYYIDCSSCNTEDCDDEGACTIKDGYCVKKTSKECVTIGGKQTGKSCIFPFIFEGIKHKGCTDTSKPWCATIVDVNWGYIEDKWGYCATGCKVHGGGIFWPMWTEKPMHKWIDQPTKQHKKVPGDGLGVGCPYTDKNPNSCPGWKNPHCTSGPYIAFMATNCAKTCKC